MVEGSGPYKPPYYTSGFYLEFFCLGGGGGGGGGHARSTGS